MKYLVTLIGLIVSLNSVMAQDPASVHGMLLFGSQKTYLSHLPMFHSPHDYQAIMEVELDQKAQMLYFADQKDHPNTYYTIVPPRFVLPEVIQNKKSFTAQIYRGHFERDGEHIGNAVNIQISKVIYFKKLHPAPHTVSMDQYLIFGSQSESFAAHFIQGAPNFDQILKVGALPECAGTTCFAKSVSGGSQPLKTSGSTRIILNGKCIVLNIQKQIYLEFDDLKH